MYKIEIDKNDKNDIVTNIISWNSSVKHRLLHCTCSCACDLMNSKHTSFARICMKLCCP
jgi:hypothetical protein